MANGFKASFRAEGSNPLERNLALEAEIPPEVYVNALNLLNLHGLLVGKGREGYGDEYFNLDGGVARLVTYTPSFPHQAIQLFHQTESGLKGLSEHLEIPSDKLKPHRV
jgi:hypothetical protein